MRKRNQYFKNARNTKTIFKIITDAPNGDAKIALDDDATDVPNTADYDAGSTDSQKSPYLLINRNHAPNATDDDYASPDDSTSPDFLIDSKLKRKIDPR